MRVAKGDTRSLDNGSCRICFEGRLFAALGRRP